jgi:hypothetical protein
MKSNNYKELEKHRGHTVEYLGTYEDGTDELFCLTCATWWKRMLFHLWLL